MFWPRFLFCCLDDSMELPCRPTHLPSTRLSTVGSIRKYVVRVASYHANRTNHQHQNNGQHNCILGDVLALFTPPQPATVEDSSSRLLSRYCLSYTALLLIFLPFGSVPRVVTVRLLPSADTTIRPLVMSFPPFLTLSPNVRSSIFVYDRASEFGSPVTG